MEIGRIARQFRSESIWVARKLASDFRKCFLQRTPTQNRLSRRAPVNRRKRRFRSRIRSPLQGEPRWHSVGALRCASQNGDCGQANYMQNVWDIGAVPMRSCQAKLRSRLDRKDGGSPAWIRTTIHGSKGRCPTVRRPGNMQEARQCAPTSVPSPSRRLERRAGPNHSPRFQ